MGNSNTPSADARELNPLVNAGANAATPEYICFLKFLGADDWHNLVAIHPSTNAVQGRTFPPHSWDAIQRWIEPLLGNWNVYFSANEPLPDAPNKKLSRPDIGAIRVTQLDLDPAKDATGAAFQRERARLREVIRAEMETDPENYPSATIDSGGGFQVLWRLEAKLPAPLHIEAVESQNRGLAQRFGGDPNAIDICRILRLPGTLNLPTPTKVMRGRERSIARTVEITDNTITLDELGAWAPPARATKVTKPAGAVDIYMAAVETVIDYNDLPPRIAGAL